MMGWEKWCEFQICGKNGWTYGCFVRLWWGVVGIGHFTLGFTRQYSQSRQLMVPVGGFWKLWPPRFFIPRGRRSVVPWMGMVRVVIENAIGVVRRALPVPFREMFLQVGDIKKPLDSLRIGWQGVNFPNHEWWSASVKGRRTGLSN